MPFRQIPQHLRQIIDIEMETGTAIDGKIISFIRKHHVLTLATVAGDTPWCSNMFYAYIPGDNVFVFTSEDHTRHATEALSNYNAAASIVLETRTVGKVQGLQVSGRIRKAGDDHDRFKKAYIKRFPYAAMAGLNLWVFEPLHYKLTDNTLGFGKKIVWKKETPDK